MSASDQVPQYSILTSLARLDGHSEITHCTVSPYRKAPATQNARETAEEASSTISRVQTFWSGTPRLRAHPSADKH